MLPRSYIVFGLRLDVWDISLLVWVAIGYAVLVASFRIGGPGRKPRMLALRYFITVYITVLGAQLFSYAFDLKTTLIPPPHRHWIEYYFDPTAGPKTLYGVIVFLPLAAWAVSVPWRDLKFGEALERWTPALMTVLGGARIGCFLQGCCYGVRSELFGIAMPKPSQLFFHHRSQGWISDALLRSLPAVPTQLIESVGSFVIAAIAFRQLRRQRSGVFASAIVSYSVLRFVVEFIRDDGVRNHYGPLSTSQWIALVIVGSAAAFFVATKRPGDLSSSRRG